MLSGLFFLGFGLLCLPYILVLSFTSKREGFFWITLGVVIFHLVLAVILQALGLFTYPIVLGFNIVAALSSLAFFSRSNWKRPFFAKPWVSWFVPIFFFIIFACLFSVHHSYSGLVSMINGKQAVVHQEYPYPYFSDEWLGVAFANYSIASHHLPLVNPLLPHAPVEYFVFAFYAILAELFLLVHTAPLFAYVFFALLSGFGICFLTYEVLRAYKVPELPAILTVVGLIYVVNGSNLPGLWVLIPFAAGYAVFLLMLGFMAYKRPRGALFAAALSFLLYPALIVFIFPALCGFLYRRSLMGWKRILKWGLLFVAAALLLLVLGSAFSSRHSLVGSFREAWSLIVRPASDSGFPAFYLWTVLPFPFYLLAFYGMYLRFKNHLEILLPIIVGLLLWFVYSFWLHVFIMDYSRVVVATAWLLVLVSGFALQKVFAFCETHPNWKHGVAVIFLCVFCIASFFYTEDTRYESMLLAVPQGPNVLLVSPASPASQYLTADDLSLFSGISHQYFLAPAWKGLVIAAATGNYPLESKESTITNHILSYDQFLLSGCDQKEADAKKKNLTYVYAKTFFCPAFVSVGTSSEGLILYRFNR